MNDILIAELEAATEGSRELDAKVWCALNGYHFVKQITNGFGECQAFYRNTAKVRAEHVSGEAIAPYTTSIDAALPHEHIVEVYELEVVEGEPLGMVWEAWNRDDTTDTPILTMGCGHTEALARRIAALKARA